MQIHYIAWFSAAGTTRQVADMLADLLHEHGIDARMVDLGPAGGADIAALGAAVPPAACVWLGSPVYVDHALPQVLEFIHALPEADLKGSAVAVPFVTWGAVCSGVALAEMARELKRKGWRSIGAAKVLAQHSSLWNSSVPLAQGRPDTSDRAQLEMLVTRVLARLATGQPHTLAPEELNYLPAARVQEAQEKSLAKMKMLLGEHQPQHERCDRCGICIELCPAGALSWKGRYPQVGESCVRCHQCTRHCPQQAFPFNAAMMEERLQQLAAASPEVAETQIYL